MKKLFVFVLLLVLVGMSNWLGCNFSDNTNYHPRLLQPGSYTIVCFGDSTTEVAPEHGIVYQQNLEKELPGYNIVGKVINSGVSGNTTAAARARFDKDVLAHDPDLVIIQFGLNDSAVDVWKNPPATDSRVLLSDFINNMTYFVQTLKARGAKVVLMTTNGMSWTKTTVSYAHYPPYLPNDRWGLDTILEIYNPAIRDIAKAEDVPLADIYQMYKDYDHVSVQDFNDLLDDGVHPNTAGHRLTTDALIKIIVGGKP